MFKVTKQSKKSHARTATLKTAHGTIRTPFFMPIATKGAVKSLTSDDIRSLRAQIILSNTYHQLLRPGLEVLKKASGLHKFMDWDGPMLTDSGGFQVFSLTKIRKILPNGVKFRSHIDGKEFLLTSKKALEIQKVIGSDIRMVLDVCPAYGCSKREAEDAVSKTTKWAKESLKNKAKDKSLLFAIVQGSTDKDLRLKSARELVDLNFDGYAIGGLAVGEPGKEMLDVLDYTVPALPKDKPHYLMGLGYPEQIIEAVKRGIDMFDCVIPTREARHGRLYFWKNDKFKYEAVSITNAKFAKDFSEINPDSKLRELKTYTKAYLHHLFRTQEPLSIRLATLNNVEFYLELMSRIRAGIRNGGI
jgi:queuine tRNA-ribosyltransferase